MVYKASSHPQYDSNVVNIQRNLNEIRPKAEEFFRTSLWGQVATDGKYGPKTAEAVKAFQKAFNCSPYDGIYGPSTDAAMRHAFTQLKIIENAKPVATSIHQSSSSKTTPAPVCSSATISSEPAIGNEAPVCSINYTPANPICHQDSFMCSTLCTSSPDNVQLPTISTNDVERRISEQLSKGIRVIANTIWEALKNFTTAGSILDTLIEKIRDLVAQSEDLKKAIETHYNNFRKTLAKSLENIKKGFSKSTKTQQSRFTSLAENAKGSKAIGAAAGAGFIIDTFLTVRDVFKLAFGKNDHPVTEEEVERAADKAVEKIFLGLISTLIAAGAVALVGAVGVPALVIGLLVSILVALIILLIQLLFGLEEGDIGKEISSLIKQVSSALYEFGQNYGEGILTLAAPYLFGVFGVGYTVTKLFIQDD